MLKQQSWCLQKKCLKKQLSELKSSNLLNQIYPSIQAYSLKELEIKSNSEWHNSFDNKITNLFKDLNLLYFQKSKQLLKEHNLLSLFKEVHKCLLVFGENLYLLQTCSFVLAAKINNLILAFKNLFNYFKKRKERKTFQKKITKR